MKNPAALLALLLSFTLSPLASEEKSPAKSYYHFSLSELYRLEGRNAEAAAELAKAIEIDPANARLHVELARSMLTSRRMEPALRECRKAVELDPENADARLLLGQILIRQKPAEALVELEEAVRLAPNNFEGYYYLGHLYSARGELSKAVDAFSEVLQRRPTALQIYYLKADALNRAGRVEEAIETAQTSLDLNADDPRMLGLLADLYERNRQFGPAIDIYRSLLTEALSEPGQLERIRLKLGRLLNGERRFVEAGEVLEELLDRGVAKTSSTYLRAQQEWATALSGMGERDKAIEKLEQLIEVASDASERRMVEVDLALLYQRARRVDRAVALFQKLSDDSPGNPSLRLLLASALSDGDRHGKALEMADQARDSLPDDADPRIRRDVTISRAQILSKAGQVRKAVDSLRELPTADVGTETAYSLTVDLYMSHQLYSEARETLEKALADHPSSEILQFQKAAFFERQKSFKEAEVEFKKILEINPEHHLSLNYLGYMLADQGIELETALVLVQRAVDLEPFNGSYLDSLGWVYFRLDKLDLAEQYLTQAVRLNDGDATIFEHLGDLQVRLGQVDKARQSYRSSLRFATDDGERERAQRKLDKLDGKLPSGLSQQQ